MATRTELDARWWRVRGRDAGPWAEVGRDGHTWRAKITSRPEPPSTTASSRDRLGQPPPPQAQGPLLLPARPRPRRPRRYSSQSIRLLSRSLAPPSSSIRCSSCFPPRLSCPVRRWRSMATASTTPSSTIDLEALIQSLPACRRCRDCRRGCDTLLPKCRLVAAPNLLFTRPETTDPPCQTMLQGRRRLHLLGPWQE
jgi:hypothetical protein